MGLAVVERRAGTLVWIQNKKNGSWWPGIVVDPTELHITSRRIEESSVKLLGTSRFNDPPLALEWLNLEKSRRIKSFRSEEFNNCISEINQTQYPMEDTRLAVAIREALQLEEEMEKIFEKRKARGEEREVSVYKAKRTRRVSNTAQETKHSDDTLKATLASKVTKYNGHSENGNAEKKLKSNGLSKTLPRLAQEEKLKRKQKISNLSNGLKPKLNEKSFSRTKYGSNYNEDLWVPSIFVTKMTKKAINNGIYNMMDKKLIDVEVKVQASSIGNHVPLVSLVSKLNGKAIIGYPINIESEPKACRNSEIIATRLNLVRKKRTPVLYVPKNESSPKIKIDKNRQGSGLVASCVPLAKIFSEIRQAFG